MTFARPGSILCVALLVFATHAAGADEHEQLNQIYRLFFNTPVVVDEVARSYDEKVIHVGRSNTPLISGKSDFLNINIAPLAESVNSGHLKFEGTVYIVRRIVSGDIANDVGYLHSTIQLPDGESLQQLQKFSWVFMKSDDRWRVITDFDATPAPLELLDDMNAEIVIN